MSIALQVGVIPPPDKANVISSVIGLPDDQGVVAESFLYTEKAPMELGDRQITRVSDVEYEDGEWVARLRDGKEIARNKSREVVLEEERRVIDGMIARGEEIPKGFAL